MSKKISFLIKLLVSLGILFVLFRLVPYNELSAIYKSSQKIYILISFFVFVVTILISIVRWKFLLSSLGINASLKEAMYSSFSGLFFNLIFPSFVAGDIFKSFSISKRHGEAKKVASSVLMDRYSGSVGLVFVAFFSYLAGRRFITDKEVTFSLSILCLLIGVASLIIFSKRVFSLLLIVFRKDSKLRAKLVSFHDNLYFFRKNPAVFLKSMLFSVPIQILTPITFYTASKAFGVNIGIIYFFILVPIVMMIALIPITIAGAGTREAAAVYFFSLIGIGKSIGLSISLLNLAFTIAVGLLGGVFYVTVYHRRLQYRP